MCGVDPVARVEDIHWKPKPRIRYQRPKTMTRPRYIPLTLSVASTLREHIALNHLKLTDHLFEQSLRPNVECAHRHARQAVGQSNLRLKDLRHLAAIAWRLGGVDIVNIRDLLGHSTLAQTTRYTDVVSDEARDSVALRAMESAFAKPATGN